MSPAARVSFALATVVAILGAAASLSSQPADAAAPLTVLSRDGRRTLAVSMVDGREVVGLDDLSVLFDLSVREDVAAGALTVTSRNRTIVLTPDQAVASSGGRLISLSSPPRRLGRRWVVPIDFISRALAPVYDSRIELRLASRLIVVGDLRVPRVMARYEPGSDGVRVMFEIEPRVGTSVSQEQNRLLVRFEADGIDALLPAPPAQAQDWIAGIRVVDAGPMIQIDLGPRAASYHVSSPPQEPGPFRLMVDLQQGTSEPTVAQVPQLPPETPPVFATPSRPTVRAIAVDPGHGGDDIGAQGEAGALEKDVSLAVARRLKTAVEGRLGIRVLLTRDEDRAVGLDQRAAIANNNKADLFISLHANASPRASTAGVEILYLSRNRFADRARELAESQRQMLPVFGGGSREIVFVQWDLAQAYHIDRSAALASVIDARLRDQRGMGGVTVQQAAARVLTGANMPAVLIEMGYLSNPDQARALASGEFQGSMAQALCDAVVSFRQHLEQGTPATPAAPGSPAAAASHPKP